MKIIVGISGGIAAYKVPQLVRLLVKDGHEVRCVATSHALEFVTRLTLETVSGTPLYSDLFAPTNDHSTEHISLKDWGDAMFQFSHFEVDLREPDSQYRTLYVVYRYDTTVS